MAWQEVETDIGAKIGRCSYSVHLKHGGARVSLPEVVAKELGWTAKTRFKLQVGAGESEGALRVVADAKGKISGKSAPKGGGLTIRLGRWPSLAPRDVDKVSVEHEVQREASALVVRLPTHAQAVAPAPRTMVAPTIPPQANGKVDVSSKFFNDPKPPANGRPVSRPPGLAAK